MRRTAVLALVLLASCPRPDPKPADAGCQATTCVALGANCGAPSDGCGGALACGTCSEGLECSSSFRCGAPCQPKTCAELDLLCGPADDGCGHALDCGACTEPDTCGGGGQAGRCGCTSESQPDFCARLEANCGQVTAADNCGVNQSVFCGSCSEVETCGGGGPNLCGCPETDTAFCQRLGKNCGTVIDLDACDLPRTVDCGMCSGPLSCGGSGQPNVCGDGTCVAMTCTDRHADCGHVSDGCGNLLDCGACVAPASCGGGGQPNLCGVGTCVPMTCAERYKDCGQVDDGCGQMMDCGACTSPTSCGGGGVPNVCGCTPKTCDQVGLACGAADDGCGGTVECECPAPMSCGGGGVAGQCGCTPRACGQDCGEVYDGCGHMLDCGACPAGTTPQPFALRVVASNLTSGNKQSYDPGEGSRILQALAPDVVLIQEFNYGMNDPQSIRRFIETTFGTSFFYYREGGAQIPNGVVSRYPIIESGEWDDVQVGNRDFAWAHIDLPGPHDLWAVSLHLLTTSSGTRASEASALVARIKAVIPASDYLVVGGDLNTGSRTEGCITTLRQVVVTAGPWPADQSGNGNTNAARRTPLDWVMPDADLNAFKVPVVIGSQRFTDGLVFDSRVYNPLSEVAPVLSGDSGATNMQHMAVVRDFSLPR